MEPLIFTCNTAGSKEKECKCKGCPKKIQSYGRREFGEGATAPQNL